MVDNGFLTASDMGRKPSEATITVVVCYAYSWLLCNHYYWGMEIMIIGAVGKNNGHDKNSIKHNCSTVNNPEAVATSGSVPIG